MKCPFCGDQESKVVDSRHSEDGLSIRRRRECIACQRRFTTYEIVESLPIIVVKRNGSRQNFDRNKILNSTNSWYDPVAEGEAANLLMSKGCAIIGQHADTTGAPFAAQRAFNSGENAFCVGYNIDMLPSAPDAALTSPTNDWSVYYTYALRTIIEGGVIDTDWCHGYSEAVVDITDLGPHTAAGTAEAVAAKSSSPHLE